MCVRVCVFVFVYVCVHTLCHSLTSGGFLLHRFIIRRLKFVQKAKSVRKCVRLKTCNKTALCANNTLPKPKFLKHNSALLRTSPSSDISLHPPPQLAPPNATPKHPSVSTPPTPTPPKFRTLTSKVEKGPHATFFMHLSFNIVPQLKKHETFYFLMSIKTQISGNKCNVKIHGSSTSKK